MRYRSTELLMAPGVEDLAARERESLENAPLVYLKAIGLNIGKDMSTPTFDEVVQNHIWGTFGPSGQQELRWIRLIDASNAHLENILATQTHIQELTKRVILRILRDRAKGVAQSDTIGYAVVATKVPQINDPNVKVATLVLGEVTSVEARIVPTV